MFARARTSIYFILPTLLGKQLLDYFRNLLVARGKNFGLHSKSPRVVFELLKLLFLFLFFCFFKGNAFTTALPLGTRTNIWWLPRTINARVRVSQYTSKQLIKYTVVACQITFANNCRKRCRVKTDLPRLQNTLTTWQMPAMMGTQTMNYKRLKR